MISHQGTHLPGPSTGGLEQGEAVHQLFGLIYNNWLVVLTILKNTSQWEGLSHILWKIKNVPNHQPDKIKGIKKSIFYVKIEESIIMNIWNWKKWDDSPCEEFRYLWWWWGQPVGSLYFAWKKWLLKGQSDWIIGDQNTELDKLISGSPCLCFNMSMPFLTIIYTAVVVYQPDGTRTWQMLPCKVPTFF